MRQGRRRQRPATREQQIWEALELAVEERQQRWMDQVQAVTPDWAVLLSLHLQLAELEHLEDALAEFIR